MLAASRPDLVPELLAIDDERGWMLQRDGGSRLREMLAGEPGVDRWADILPLQAELQIAAAGRVDDLLAVGTPDRRLEALPGQLARLIDDRSALQPDVAGTLDDAEINRLERQVPRLVDLCHAVANAGLPAAVVHGDLNDGQVFLRDGRYRFLDWGDASVGHPFFVTVVPLRVLAFKLRIRQLDPALDALRDAYLEPWTAIAPATALRALFADAYRLGSLARLLDWHETVRAAPPEVAVAYDFADAVPTGVRLLLETLDGDSRLW